VFFFHKPKEKMGKKFTDYFWGFWCGMMNVRDNKLVRYVLKTRGKHAILFT
jgi:hypothetical protein